MTPALVVFYFVVGMANIIVGALLIAVHKEQ